MIPVDALLFDLGGVIIDVDFDRALTRWAEAAGSDVAQLRGRFSLDDPYKRHEIGAIGAEAYFDSLRTSLGIAISDADFHAGWRAILGEEMPGMAKLLADAAAKRPLYLFSNSNLAHERDWSLRFASILGHFRKIFVSSSLGLRKPDAAAFQAVIQAIGAPADRILFFDDNAENVAGAERCGLRAAQVRSSADITRALKRAGL